MRAIITFAMLVLAVMVGFLTVAVAQPSPPPAPAPSQPAPQQPATQPNGPAGPTAAPGISGLYNVLNYGRNGARCTPSPLVPTACR